MAQSQLLRARGRVAFGASRGSCGSVIRPFRPTFCITPKAVAAQRSGPPDEAEGTYECATFYDHSGNIIQPMCADYGFRSGSGRLYSEHYGETPGSFFELAKSNFQQELVQLRQFTRFNNGIEEDEGEQSNLVQKAIHAMGGAAISLFSSIDVALEKAGVLSELSEPKKKMGTDTASWKEIRAKLAKLKLDNNAVVRMEKERVSRDGDIDTPLWVKAPFTALCWTLDILYENKPIPKFWVLETVARIPYFSYISILHLYESVGFWRAGAELRKIHFAEEWNEMHHLQIMESLGGDLKWFDRFVANHAAIAYYWLIILFYVVNPKLAYNFMQRVELHAMDTYAEFVDSNRELLASVPPPRVALDYYLNEDLYLFDSFQQGAAASPRRPTCNNLLDVFINIRDDEAEHVKTMSACQDESIAAQIAKDRNTPAAPVAK